MLGRTLLSIWVAASIPSLPVRYPASSPSVRVRLKSHLRVVGGDGTIMGTQGVGTAGVYDVRSFGAKGDGVAMDSDAINRAIDAAAAAGGGTVRLPAGKYRSVSIRLKSHITLSLDQGAVIVAAKHEPGVDYDAPEPNPSHTFQDYGHSYFHNSLIWGERLEDIAILGQGEIYGKGLASDTTNDPLDGNKSISLRECRNVLIRDVTIRHGGWFCILATGVDHFTMDNLIMDTNRDGIDIDCCRDVHLSNSSINSPGDDGIVLKSSYALNEARATENVTITNCHVCGFQEGSFLNNTYVRKGHPTGRIKFGTESNGGFKNIAISNCVFDYSSGFALETVDGGYLEDVTISNITMRDIMNPPFFLRLGRRMRGPAGTPIGVLRRVSISNVRVVNAVEGSIIAGIPGNTIDDVTFSNIVISMKGGAKPEQANIVPPELETNYPEPGMFGKLPATGFFIRHVKNIQFFNVQVTTAAEDGRPPFLLDSVDGADFAFIKGQHSEATPVFRFKSVKNFRARMVDGVPDTVKAQVDDGNF